MRCLYCNQKLSLLKLAKGDSFCSEEHFDAYQLKILKEGFEQLTSTDPEESPGEPAAEEENAIEVAQPEAAEAGSPPYAPFASPERPPSCPPSAVENGPEADQPVAAVRALVLPVHDVRGTIGILNLYYELGLVQTEPRNWSSPRQPVVTPEYFQVETRQPRLESSPEHPENENLAGACSFEAVPPVDAFPLMETIETAASINLTMPAEPASLAPIEPAEPGIPFLIAPSFQERTGTPILIHGAADSVPRHPTIEPVVDQPKLPRLDSCDAIPKSTCFARNNAFHLEDSTTFWIKGSAELAVAPGIVLADAKEPVREYAWSPSDSRVDIAWHVLQTSWTSTEAAGHALPETASLMVRQGATELERADPQKLLPPLDTFSLFLGVLKTHPLGQEPYFIDRPARAMDLVWRASLAPFPAWENLSAAWQPENSCLSLPYLIAQRSVPPMVPLPPFPYTPVCLKIERMAKTDLPAPYGAIDRYRPTAWRESDSATVPLRAEPRVVLNGSRVLPHAAQVPPGRLKTGSGAPGLTWKPLSVALPYTAVVKSLPVRNRTILLTAKS
jgi:hypothetical protein